MGLTQTLAHELVDAGVRVNAVCPGPVTGERIEQVMDMHMQAEGHTDYGGMRGGWEGVPMKRFAEPEEVAKAVAFLVRTARRAREGARRARADAALARRPAAGQRRLELLHGPGHQHHRRLHHDLTT
jgi:NAD(P)-dependent dehydrogenase (short-subunit alcohol dehydrogenase family)